MNGIKLIDHLNSLSRTLKENPDLEVIFSYPTDEVPEDCGWCVAGTYKGHDVDFICEDGVSTYIGEEAILEELHQYDNTPIDEESDMEKEFNYFIEEKDYESLKKKFSTERKIIVYLES